MFLLLFEVVIYTFISFSQYLKKDWREIEMKPGSYLGKRRFDWIVQIDWIVSKSNRFSRIININFNWSTDNFLTNERKIYPYPTTRGEKTENGGDQKRVSPSRCMRGDAVLANCALASQRLHLQLCSCLQIAVCVCVCAACTHSTHGLPTYYLHTLKRNLIVRVCVRADFISQRRGDTEWRRAK